MDTEIRITITGLVYNQTIVGTYGLVMSEADGNRRFSVMIGEPEAQSIALKINNKKSPRPLTHDLIHSILATFKATLEKVVIYDMVNDIFFSELHLQKDDESFVIDARTSDAVALAVRSDSPIFIKAEILDIVGTVVEADEDEEATGETTEPPTSYSDKELEAMSVRDLNGMLEEALNEENYELAARLRDAINKKSNK
jgi:bifunctional DNase/RNase